VVDFAVFGYHMLNFDGVFLFLNCFLIDTALYEGPDTGYPLFYYLHCRCAIWESV
jgi:hypothetical protein